MSPRARAATAASGIALAMPILFAVTAGIGAPARAPSAAIPTAVLAAEPPDTIVAGPMAS